MRILPIHHTFGPHVDWRYALRSELLLLQPWRWKKGSSREKFRSNLAKRFSADVHLFGSGREGLLALLESLNFAPGSEVIIQGYTCVALPNAIHAAGYTPVYADISTQTLNLDTESVKKCVTPRTKAIICQHTSGIPADTLALKQLCSTHGLQLIEDCAHVIHDSVGSDGNFVMLSFGRDKAISGVSGGAIVSRNTIVSDILKQRELEAVEIPATTIGRLLCYATIYWKSRFFYGIGPLGKGILHFCKTIKLLVPVLTTAEKAGRSSNVIHRMPNACCVLANTELRNVATINSHRQKLSSFYEKHLDINMFKEVLLQKYPLLLANPDAARQELKQANVHLDDGWTGAVVCPRSCNLEAANYTLGSCPLAEDVAKKILCLPTHKTMSLKQATKLVELVKPFLDS